MGYSITMNMSMSLCVQCELLDMAFLGSVVAFKCGVWSRHSRGQRFTTTNYTWTFDIFLTFNTGFFLRGSLELTRRKVALQYCKTWLMFDLCIVSMDCVFIFMQAEVSALSAFRGARAIRTIRLMRILKMSSLGDK